MTAKTQDSTARGNRRRLQGVVSSTSMDKSIVVRVERTFRHPKYGKFVRRHKHFMAHDEEGRAGLGDLVEIVSCRPLSKRKRWRLVDVVRQSSAPMPTAAEATDALSEELSHQESERGSELENEEAKP